ncbi:MAG TPA: hypothetical protein VGE34_04900 [Candidatus Saccharimonadales bacterium]
MAEQLNNNQEHEAAKQEALDARSKEHHERLKEDRERSAERSHEDDAQDARAEIEKLDKDTGPKKQERSPAEKRKDTILKNGKASPEKSFKLTMKEAQREMSAPSRTFSKLIHNKAVEKTSEVLGDTVARPNALLSGALVALLFTTVLYLWARYAGYPLSGFETIAAFIVGYLVGIIFDFLKIMITGKK